VFCTLLEICAAAPFRRVGSVEKHWHRNLLRRPAFSAIVYAAFDMRRDHNQINRIKDECRRAHSDAGAIKQCIADLALRRAKEPELP
jgi:hypothetical protein